MFTTDLEIEEKMVRQEIANNFGDDASTYRSGYVACVGGVYFLRLYKQDLTKLNAQPIEEEYQISDMREVPSLVRMFFYPV